MADTGEDRELKGRVNAHQAKVARETKKLAQKTSQRSGRKGQRANVQNRQGKGRML